MPLSDKSAAEFRKFRVQRARQLQPLQTPSGSDSLFHCIDPPFQQWAIHLQEFLTCFPRHVANIRMNEVHQVLCRSLEMNTQQLRFVIGNPQGLHTILKAQFPGLFFVSAV